MNLVGPLLSLTLQFSGNISIQLGETLGRRKAERNCFREGTCTCKAGAARRMGNHVAPSAISG